MASSPPQAEREEGGRSARTALRDVDRMTAGLSEDFLIAGEPFPKARACVDFLLFFLLKLV